jgi:autotransporter-associated beta strand protein
MKHLINQLLIAAAFAVGVQPNSARAGTHTWTGAGANDYWNNTANWSGGAPTVGEAAPVVLIFPGGVAPVNNIVGLTVDSIRFTGNHTVLHGSGGGTLTFRGTGGTNVLTTIGTNGIAPTLPISLSGSNYFFVADGTQFGIDSAISGTGIVKYNGAGYVGYGGPQANTATGKVIVMDNTTLTLAKPAGINAIAGPLEVRDGGSRVTLRASNQIVDWAPIKLVDWGYLDLGGCDDTVGNITLDLGEVNTAGGLLTLSGTLIPIGPGNTVWGRLALGGVTRTLYMTGNDSLSIRANISNGGAAAGFTKTGAGILLLWGTNTFTGPVTIDGGTVELHKDSALGSSAAGTTVSANGTLRLMGVNIGAEALTLNGELDAYNTNTCAGPVTVGGAPVIDLNGIASQLTLSQAVSGGGSLTKRGTGTLVLSGAQANTFTGGFMVTGGNVALSKAGVLAVPGPLQISTGTVKLLQAHQIADAAAVTVQTGAMFDLNNFTDMIGSLAGNGSVNVGMNTLTTGGNNSSTTFGGVIYGIGTAPLVKNGSGSFTLTGTNSCSGKTTVNGGNLVVNGELPGLVTLNNSAALIGHGKVGNLNSASGNVHPGLGIGKLRTSNIALTNAASSMNFEIAGSTPGVGHDQIVVNGVVTLNNVTLNVSATGAGALGNQYVLIVNDGADAVSGTFNGLPEGATVTSGLVQFTISYHGGTGNDVVLTQTGVPPLPQITQIIKLPNGQMQIIGKGLEGHTYQIEANSNLGTTNWSVLGSVEANWNSEINFTDDEAANFPQRFYRLKMQ